MYLLSTVLAFAEVLVLFVSAVGLFVLAASLVINKLLGLMDATVKAGSSCSRKVEGYFKIVEGIIGNVLDH